MSIFTWKASDAAAVRIADCAERGLAARVSGQVEQEPQLTDRILGRLEAELESEPIEGFTWAAYTLSDRGPHSAESIYGADVLVVVNINTSELRVQKGFLAQAKLLDNGHDLSSTEASRLVKQCDDMLHVTPDSFVWIYRPTSIDVIPASSIRGSAEPGRLQDPTHWTFRYFLKAFFDCFIGDREFKAATRAELEEVARRYRARRALLLTMRG